jgi:hypothetical protein
MVVQPVSHEHLKPNACDGCELCPLHVAERLIETGDGSCCPFIKDLITCRYLVRYHTFGEGSDPT